MKLWEKRCPFRFWHKIENRISYLCWLGEILGYKKDEDWYRVSSNDVVNNCGRGFLDYYKGSIRCALTECKPDFDWIPWLFKQTNSWDDRRLRKKYLIWLGDRLGYKKLEDWYNVTYGDFCVNFGRGFMGYYGNSPINALKDCFSEYNWIEWFFSTVPNNFWQNKNNRINYFNWLGQKLNYHNLDDWYNITRDILMSNHGHRVLVVCGGLEKILAEMFPDDEIETWRFSFISRGFWQNINNLKKYMNWLGRKLNYCRIDDWYKVANDDFVNNYGDSLLVIHGGYRKILNKVFPEYEWKPWLFASSNKYWDDYNIQSEYMNWLGRKLNFNKPDDWYAVTVCDFLNNDGRGLLAKYISHVDIVKNCFKDYNWHEWKFKNHKNFWNIVENRHRYIKWLGNQLGIKKLHDWYKVSYKDFKNNYGGSMFSTYYNSSVFSVVSECFPFYDWKEWLFNKVASRFWSNKSNINRYMNWLGEKLGFSKVDHWYQICIKDFYRNRGQRLLQIFGDAKSCVMENIVYDWKPEKFVKGKKMQKRLYRIVKKHFPDAIFDFKHPNMRFSSGRMMELDIWIPSINTGIEYQGECHFNPNVFGVDSYNDTIRRDKEKKEVSKKININLLEISYKDWNGDKSYIENIIIPYKKETLC